MDELKDALEESSPSVEQADSTPAQVEAPAEATAQKAEPKEPPFNEHPRWREIQAEREQARKEAEYWRQQAEKTIELAKGFQPKQVENDPYADMSPEEKAFFQRIELIAEKKAEEKINTIKKTYDPYIERYERESVASIVDDFKARNPDITPEEEIQIAKIAKPLRDGGYSVKDALNLAYQATCSAKIAQKTVQQVKAQNTQKIQQKTAANLETSTISSALPTKQPKESVRDFANRMFKEGKF